MKPLFRSRISTTRVVAEGLQDNRRHGHVHVLSAFRDGVGPSPRHHLGVLWHIDPERKELLVQAAEAPLELDRLGRCSRWEGPQSLEPGREFLLELDRSCQKTPPSDVPEDIRAQVKAMVPKGEGRCYRSKPVIVPEEERPDWAAARLTAIGLEVIDDSLQVGSLRFAPLGAKRKGIPYVSIASRVRVADAPKAELALHGGTGKGKNYGLGLLRLSAP